LRALPQGGEAVAAAHDHAARETVGDSGARLEVVAVGLEGQARLTARPRVEQAAGQVEAGGRDRSRRAEGEAPGLAVEALGGGRFIVPAQAEVERQADVDLPVVLSVEDVVEVLPGEQLVDRLRPDRRVDQYVRCDR